MGEEHLTASELLERTDMKLAPQRRSVTPAELETWLETQGVAVETVSRTGDMSHSPGRRNWAVILYPELVAERSAVLLRMD